MKKFVIVMIAILVLFVFLMLNYLLWDKENLLKQSEHDKIEQDWLRGQNRTLQATVNEQEQTIKALEKKRTSCKPGLRTCKRSCSYQFSNRELQEGNQRKRPGDKQLQDVYRRLAVSIDPGLV